MSKPSVNKRCVANSYAAPNERIIEFSGKAGGGLISFRETEGGGLVVSIYRCDAPVQIRTPLHDAVRACIAAVRAHDDVLNSDDTEPHGAQPPTGDDYNAIFGEIMLLEDLVATGED